MFNLHTTSTWQEVTSDYVREADLYNERNVDMSEDALDDINGLIADHVITMGEWSSNVEFSDLGDKAFPAPQGSDVHFYLEMTSTDGDDTRSAQDFTDSAAELLRTVFYNTPVALPNTEYVKVAVAVDADTFMTVEVPVETESSRGFTRLTKVLLVGRFNDTLAEGVTSTPEDVARLVTEGYVAAASMNSRVLV